MANRARSTFQVVGWDPAPYGEEGVAPHLSRATVKKEFTGDLQGTSTAELLMCQADTSDLAAGAGYVASELVEGELEGRPGSFVLQHWGVSDQTGQRTGGHVVPGSGTGDLEGLSGEVRISVDDDGTHRIELEYTLP